MLSVVEATSRSPASRCTSGASATVKGRSTRRTVSRVGRSCMALPSFNSLTRHLLHGAIDGGDEAAIRDYAVHGFHVGIHHRIGVDKWHQLAHQTVCRAGALSQAGLGPNDMLAKINALGCRHQFQGENVLH